MKRKVLAVLLATLLATSSLLLSGCGGSSGANSGNTTPAASATPVEFTIGFCTWIGYAPLYIAEENGYFAEAGIKPKLTIIEDESQYAAALYSNSIQALGNVLDREVTHYASGTPETVVVAMDESVGGDGIIATAEITKVADLAGKTIGLEKASTSYFFFLSILEKNGLDESAVTIQDMGADAAGAAFIAGNLDAAVVWEPYLSQAGSRAGGHVLVSSRDYPKTIVDVLVVRSDFAEANPAAVEGLVAAWYKAVAFYKENPAKGNEIMARGLGLRTEEVAEMATGVAFFGASENATFFTKDSPDSIYAVANRASEFWASKGIIAQPIDSSKFISDVYYKAA